MSDRPNIYASDAAREVFAQDVFDIVNCREHPSQPGTTREKLLRRLDLFLTTVLEGADGLIEQVKELREENAKLAQSYRCYSCKQRFDEDDGHGLASEHFGSWLKGDRPKCEDCLRGTASWGGGPHDPFYRVRKEEYERLLRDSQALKQLRAEQEADDDDNALWS